MELIPICGSSPRSGNLLVVDCSHVFAPVQWAHPSVFFEQGLANEGN